MNTLLQDLTYAVRSLRRSPGFTLAAVGALALGIGATTAIFSIVNTVLLKPAPFPEPDRIVWLQVVSPQGRNPNGSPAKFAFWSQQTDVVQDVAAFRNGLVNFTGGDVPEQLRWAQVSVDFFRLFGTPNVQGRAFAPEEDLPNGQQVALISEQLWERRFDRGVMQEFADEPEWQIIGVVADIRDGGINRDPQPRMYVPHGQLPDGANALNLEIAPMGWIVRTRTSPQALSQAIQEELQLASGLPVSDVRTMDEVVSRSMSRQRFNMLLMTVFGATALLLAAIGIYGLMAYSVEQRTQEIGIRLALGAETGQVWKMVVLQGMRLVVAGGVVGLASASGLTRFIARFLFEVEAWDPTAFIAVPVVLTAVAMVAVMVPAHRASRVDPMLAFRNE